jgi:predicted metal-dependent peptidase
MFEIKNIHEKLLTCIQEMLIDTKVSLPYYGNFNLHVAFHERDNIGTCGVNVTSSGMNFYYSPKFLEHLSQKEVNFVTIHEDFHLLFDHPRRTSSGIYQHRLANIAQDMIINHIIWEDISHNFVEIPKDKDGRNMALFIPAEYPKDKKLIFEEVYEWLKEEKEKREEQKKKGSCSDSSCQSCNGTGQKQDKNGKQNGQNGQGNQSQNGQNGNQNGQNGQGNSQNGNQNGQNGQGNSQNGNQNGNQNGQGNGQGNGNQNGQNGQGNDPNGNGQDGDPCPDCNGTGNDMSKSYGPFGKKPGGKDGETVDTWSLDHILDNLDKNDGQYMDVHMGDDVPDELREAMVKDVMDKLQARGLGTANIESTLNKLRKKRKDYLKEIKRSISNEIFGRKKIKTITKPNRRQISGLKGNRKIKTTINVILDVSGSMNGEFERVLNYIYQNDITINFLEADTEVKFVQKLKNKKQIDAIPIKGLGGTALNPGIQYVVEHFNDHPTVILTDGYTDHLECKDLRKRVLIISKGVPCPIASTNGKLKQICIENTK